MPAALIALIASLSLASPESDENTLDARTMARFARLALGCVHREYPNKISHVMISPDDVGSPGQLTPVFCGCFDWHSAVHGHWLLVRLCRCYPDQPFAQEARTALSHSLTPEKVAAEMAYLSPEHRATFERPYGLAWLLQLAAELRQWDDPQARDWSAILKPLETLAAERLKLWLPKLSYPVRTGLHSQTAFALGLACDWAITAGDHEMIRLITERSRFYYANDRGANLSFEPSGQDFLSPAIAEADLMRRIMSAPEFAAWLGAFLPEIATDGTPSWFSPVVVTDRSDGHLVHLDGLNLSRAWMLQGIASGLPLADPRITALLAAANEHARAGLASVTGETYEGGHWLGSFAVYLVTKRGIDVHHPTRAAEHRSDEQ